MTDEVLAPWIWHGQDVYSTTDTLARKWAVSPQTAALWLAGRPKTDVAKVGAWVRVMKAAVDMAVDRARPTAEEIQECVRLGVGKGW